ncbi:MAG: hypothetical protein LUC85_01505 [Bacteroidales bacterium]|nr:hypothetical protein [Bacteroidales bacterium]
MKKLTLLACACVLALGQTLAAQEQAQEITYVDDCSQGYLFNRFKDNWFITGEGGIGINFSEHGSARDWKDRWEPTAGLYVGKWFSPLLGVRVGANWQKMKALSEIGSQYDEMYGKYYKQVYSEVGVLSDVMFNVTNWVCGYHPGRIYNLGVYVGGGAYWAFKKTWDANGDVDWKNAHDRVIAWRCGITNTFNVSKQVQIGLDLRFVATGNHSNELTYTNKTSYNAQALLNVTYLFKKREWSCPVVPVCPEPENCDAYIARLQAADARINDLERQLKDCLNRPQPEPVVEKAPLATVYYPINVYKMSKTDATVLEAVANVMKDNPNKQYVLTGWADNYTGNDQINTRLRHNRVNGVAKYLEKQGVPASQLDVTINNGNLCDLGEKYVALDRAVTIEEK